jgi:FkbM family methyltransferase
MLHRIKLYINVIQNFGFRRGMMFLIRKKLSPGKIINLSNILHPIFLRPGTSDINAFFQIFIDKEYDIDIGFEPKVIIDGGANIGLASIYLKNRYPNAKIISIEPDAGNSEMLKTNVAKYNNIFVKQAGLWSAKKKVKIVDKYKKGNWALVIEESDNNKNEQNIEIDTLTIRDIMDEYGLEYIDLLKLDVETAEKQIFSSKYMDWLPKVKVIIIELHDWMLPGCSKPFFLAINEAFNNYRFFQVGENTVILNKDLLLDFV